MKLAIVLGARPQIVKTAPLVKLLMKKGHECCLIHSGQHYDYELSKQFFEQLDIPLPAHNLEVGSETHARQSASIMSRLEPVLTEERPALVLVPGDTNTTLAAALTSVKLKIPVAHLEAGLRSYDYSMPEEINRRLTDHCSSILLTPTVTGRNNLGREGIPEHRCFLTGDTMLDIHLSKKKVLPGTPLNLPEEIVGLSKGYCLVTVHRQENTDNRQKLASIVKGLNLASQEVEIVFPAHPRTIKMLKSFGLYEQLEDSARIHLTPPVGYMEFLKLMLDASVVLTDSGGVQKEVAFCGKYGLTLRDTTEWVETIENGWNQLVRTDATEIVSKINEMAVKEKKIDVNEVYKTYGGGKATENTFRALEESEKRGLVELPFEFKLP